MNRGVVYALWDYDAEGPDELSFKEGDCLTVLRREDSEETEWWWARCADNEGYIPRNLLGVRKCRLHLIFCSRCTCVYLPKKVLGNIRELQGLRLGLNVSLW